MIKKILIRKERKEFIADLNKSVIISEGKKYFIEDISRDFHCSEGVITKSELEKENAIVTSNKGKEFFIFDASFVDSYKGIKKQAQTIPLKDLGFILAETGIGKDSVVIDTGSGSGGSACFFARHVKKVYTFDINENNIRQTQENINYFGLKNVVIKKADAYKKIPAKNADLILLDLTEPWRAIGPAMDSIRVGGFVVVYCPQITQTQGFVNQLSGMNAIHVKTVEMIERDWKVEGLIVRPRSLSNIHSGFISIFRKIG